MIFEKCKILFENNFFILFIPSDLHSFEKEKVSYHKICLEKDKIEYLFLPFCFLFSLTTEQQRQQLKFLLKHASFFLNYKKKKRRKRKKKFFFLLLLF